MKTKATLVNEMKKTILEKECCFSCCCICCVDFYLWGGHITRPLVKGIE